MGVLSEQYKLIKSSREAVLLFLEDNLSNELYTPIPVFNDKTIAYMMVHVVNTYISWLENFTLNLNKEFYDDRSLSSFDQIKSLFADVDAIMERFLSVNEDTPDRKYANYKSGNRYVEATVLELFSHVVTHEFHHKGQVMTMCRLLGQVPPDSDIIRF